MSVSGSGPFRAPPPPKILTRPPRGRVLVVAPHPDDETMGVGGTLLHHKAQGDAISAVFVCSGVAGDPGGWYADQDIEAIRQAEAHAAAEILGIGTLHFWGYPDNLSDADIHVFEGLPEDPDEARRALAKGFAERLGALLEAEGTDILYYPWDGELNGDHWVMGQGVEFLREARPDLEERISFLGYDLWTALCPEVVIDTSDVAEEKMRAVHCYRSQEHYLEYEHPLMGLDAYRSLFLERGATYGEAYRGHYKPRSGEAGA